MRRPLSYSSSVVSGNAKRFTKSAETAIIGITPGLPVDEIKQQTLDFLRASAAIVGIRATVTSDEICVLDAYVGDGYLKPTAESRAAIELAARLEGLTLDPAYTAKAFAGMLGQVQCRRFSEDQRVIFLRTAG